VQPEGRIDDHGSDFILFISRSLRFSAQPAERKIFAPFWIWEFGTRRLGGRTNQTKQGNDFTQGRGGAELEEAKYAFGNLAPWPLA